MDAALLLARLSLAVVFAVAGLGKLADQAGTRRAVRDFGVPAALAQATAMLLPFGELVVAMALVTSSWAWWGAMGTLALLAVFSAAIGLSLRSGRRPDCHCFGQIASAPIGWRTLARNAVLAGLAAFVIWFGYDGAGLSPVAWVTVLSTAEQVALLNGVLALGLGAVVVWLLVQLLAQNGRLLLRLDALETRLASGDTMLNLPPSALPPLSPVGVPVGASAPDFTLQDLDGGQPVTLASLRAAGKPVLLAFTDPGCAPCLALLPDLARWQREKATALTVVLISRGSEAANRAKRAAHGLGHFLLQQESDVAVAYHAHGTPSAVLVQPDGTIGSPLAQGILEIRALVGSVVDDTVTDHDPYATNGKPGSAESHLSQSIGQPAPALVLPDLTGTRVDLSDFRGSPTLLLFWSPRCGFCQQMAPVLRAWEASPPRGAPKLLIVSAGSIEENQRIGLQSPTVLDIGFRIGHAFGATGTPAAVLIDADGRIASPVVEGADEVLALAGIGEKQFATTGS